MAIEKQSMTKGCQFWLYKNNCEYALPNLNSFENSYQCGTIDLAWSAKFGLFCMLVASVTM